MTNKYADSIILDNPITIWALDDTLPPASVADLSGSISITANGASLATYSSISSDNGYYISSDNTAANVAADNRGIPLVFGASNITNIYPVSNLPSIIIPGFGMLNDDGKDKTYTLEFWARIKSSSHYPQKIVGPINSDNGIYVNGPFISLKIENFVGSHYVGDWNRPMLIHLTYSQLSSSLMINGESVITINHDSTNFELPTKLDANNIDQDWIGFYAYSNVPQIQLDCIAIYSYQISELKAKLHFVKGQSVEVPQMRFGNFSELPIVADYQVSKYANNYVYPGNGRWQNGIIKNLLTDGKTIYMPNYSLPKLILENTDQSFSEWCDLNNSLSGQSTTSTLTSGDTLNDDVFFRIVPDNSNISTVEAGEDEEDYYSAGYLEFEKLSFLSEPVKVIYGVYKLSATPTSNELLFRVINKNNEYFEAVVNSSNQIVYKFVSGSSTTTIDTITITNTSEKFSAGIDIDQLLIAENNIQLSSFFTNQGDLKVFLGGSSELNSTSSATAKMFRGNIYKFGFGNKDNLNKIYDLDESSGGGAEFTDGIVRHNSTILPSHFATYTLVAVNTFGIFGLDIAIDSYWEDFVPLSLLAKNVITNSSGNIAYDLEFMQLNFDHPASISSTNSTIKSYVEFSEIATSIVSENQITKTYEAVPSNSVISPNSSWLNKKYQFTDNTIVYLPSGGFADFKDLCIKISIEAKIPGIIRNPVKIKKLQIASQAYDYADLPTEIGTKYLRDVIPYTKPNTTAIVYNGTNPYTIYKDSTPYLYLNNYSGIKLVGDNVGSTISGTTVESRGIRIPINATQKDYYKVSVVQLSMLKDSAFTANTDLEIFRIKDNGNTYVVSANTTAGNTTTARIKVRTSNGTAYTQYSNVTIFVNGVEDSTTNGLAQSTVFGHSQWNMIELLFDPVLDFSNSTEGSFDITGPFVINNIADYQIDKAREGQSIVYAQWGTGTYSVLAEGTWTNVSTEMSPNATTWRDTLTGELTDISVSLDVSQIHNSFLGTGKLSIFQDFENLHKVNASQNRTTLYSDLRSSIITATPL